MDSEGTQKRPDDRPLNDSTWHLMSPDEVVTRLESNKTTGLSSTEVKQRLQKYGKNSLTSKAEVRWYHILYHHTVNFLMSVFVAAAAASFATLQYVDAGVILFLIVLNIIIGFSQEWKSEKTLADLQKMTAATASVLRDGHRMEVDVEEVVIGDIVVLEEGGKVPADVRLLESIGLECDESILTGESEPVEKTIDELPPNPDGYEVYNININTLTPPRTGDRINMAFMNTIVSKGKGKGIVTEVGNNTKIGEISVSLGKAKKEKTKLQKRLDKLGLVLVIAAFVAVGGVIAAGLSWGTLNFYPEALIAGISTAVSLLPAALIPVVTLTTTLGVRSMARNNAIVRKMAALESLGNITDICSDKTGTLTQGKMVVTDIWIPGRNLTVTGEGTVPKGDILAEDGTKLDHSQFGSTLELALLNCSLNNAASLYQMQEEPDTPRPGPGNHSVHEITQQPIRAVTPESERQASSPKSPHGAFHSLRSSISHAFSPVRSPKEEKEETRWISSGSPTEVALLVLARKSGYRRILLLAENGPYDKLWEFPFSSSLKRMSSVIRKKETGEVFLFTKGAPERIVSSCITIAHFDETTEALSEYHVNLIHQQYLRMASNGLRVLCVAYRTLPGDFDGPSEAENREIWESNLTFLGLLGIKDPPRPDVPDSIKVCHEAGITVRMLTGDHQATAVAIAKQIGILPEQASSDLSLAASRFDALTDEELKSLKSLPLVVSRCSPQRHGYVAMTGDGVNDSPAIKRADVGIAMGSGSDVTKDVADIVLLGTSLVICLNLPDDNFSTIVVAIREGRRIFANIRKFVVHLLSGNVGEVIVIVLSLIIGLELPIQPLQILWLNLVTQTPPALGLGLEPASKHIMDINYRPLKMKLFDKHVILDTLVYGSIIGGFSITAFVYYRYVFDTELREAQTATFLLLTILVLIHAYNCRDTYLPFWHHKFYSRWFLHFAVILGIGTTSLTFYIPWFRDTLFEQDIADVRMWSFAVLSTLTFLVVSEVYKLIKRIIRKIARRRRVVDLKDIAVA